MKILVINGPNMNMLGIRQPEIYGHATYEDLKSMIAGEAERLGAEVSFFQSNHEGALVDAIQQAYFDRVDGMIINRRWRSTFPTRTDARISAMCPTSARPASRPSAGTGCRAIWRRCICCASAGRAEDDADGV